MTERATVNQKLQFGAETTPGTSVSASKVLECFNLTFGIKPDVSVFTPTGHRWPSTAEENREWTEMKVDGNLDYQGFPYLVSGAWGAVTPATHSGGTNSKDYIWTPPVTGSITPKTYTIEQGDAVRAHKVSYGLVTGFNYKGTREDFSCGASMMGQLLTDAITMTASPTTVPLAPVVGSHVNIYLDTDNASLGGTQFTRAFSFEYTYDAGFGVFWALNRSNPSFTGHVDTTPKNTVKLLLEADTQGMSILPHLRAGDTLYLRMDAQGPIIENTIHYTVTHDMAIKITNVDDFSDNDGIFAIGYEGTIMEDPTWGTGGKSQIMTITNQLASL